MSTRANIKITDGRNTLWFYRHSDGYPEGALPTLNRFMDWLRSSAIRDNVGQAAGWLVVIGHQEYAGHLEPGDRNSGMGWKVGAYEPTTGLHGDTEYLYTIDLAAKTLKCQSIDRDYGTPPDYKNKPKVSYGTVNLNRAKLTL